MASRDAVAPAVPADTFVFTCTPALRGTVPVTTVTRDALGEWSFSCDEAGCPAECSLIVETDLATLLDRDGSLAAVLDLQSCETATRAAAGAHWRREDWARDQIRRNIDEHGLHIVLVPEDPTGPGWAFTIGLFARRGAPELVLHGLPPAEAAAALGSLAIRMADGAPQVDGAVWPQCLPDGRSGRLVALGRRQRRHWLGIAAWYYGHWRFPAFACTWPDPAGLWPGEVGYDAAAAPPQPALRPAGVLGRLAMRIGLV